jgi:hypothetical protein
MKSSQTVLLFVLCFAVAARAGAQSASSAGASAPASTSATTAAVADGKPTGPAEAWAAKPVGKYRITLTLPTHEMTADVTVREENGKLIANIWPVGDNDGRDFSAAVVGNQFVISGPTERGALNITLERRGSQLSGTVQFADQKGVASGSAN